VSARLGRSFPSGVLVVNLSGALLLGLLTGLALDGTVALLAGTALLGSYTTFSTWMVDSRRLAERDVRLAVANLLVSLVLGAAAAALGRWFGTAF
jgi:CrcB protein